jgi:Protein of unknown function (DUF1214)
MAAFLDSRGDPLDGGKNYKLHLPPNIPVQNFWSVIFYSNQTRSMLQTNQQFPSVSSQNQGLKTHADGSVDVYFGPNPPPGEEANWVQTVPGQGWNTLLRLYGPLEPWFNKTGGQERSSRKNETRYLCGCSNDAYDDATIYPIDSTTLSFAAAAMPPHQFTLTTLPRRNA